MKYANTYINATGNEIVATVMPLSEVPGFDPQNPPQANTYGVEDDVQCGWAKQPNGSFAPYTPPVQIPASCSRRQGLLALLGAGKLDTVEAAIAAIPDPVAKRQAEIEYEADTWERANPFLQGMWASLGGTPEELEQLYTLAVTL